MEQLHHMHALIKAEQQQRPRDHKIIVFFPTANQTKARGGSWKKRLGYMLYILSCVANPSHG